MSAPSSTDVAASGRLIFVLGAMGFSSTFTMRIIDPMVPLLADTLAYSVATVAMLATAFAITYAASQPLLGPVADILGKTKVMQACVGGLALALAGSAVAPGFKTLMALRILSGFCAGGIIPVAMATIGDRVAIEQRQVALGRFLTVIILGQVSGAVVSGVISEALGWRWVFVVGAIVAAAAGALGVTEMKPRAETKASALSVAGMLRSYRLVYANPRAIVLFTLAMLEGAAIFGMFPYAAAFLAERDGLGAAQSGFVIGGFAIGGLGFSVLVGHLVRHLGTARMMRTGGTLLAVGIGLFILPKPWLLDIAVFAFLGFAFYLIHNPFQTVATELAPEARSSAVALFASALFLGHAVGPVAIGLVKSFAGYPAAFLSCAAVMIAVAIAAPRTLPRKPT